MEPASAATASDTAPSTSSFLLPAWTPIVAIAAAVLALVIASIAGLASYRRKQAQAVVASSSSAAPVEVHPEEEEEEKVRENALTRCF